MRQAVNEQEWQEQASVWDQRKGAQADLHDQLHIRDLSSESLKMFLRRQVF